MKGNGAVAFLPWYQWCNPEWFRQMQLVQNHRMITKKDNTCNQCDVELTHLGREKMVVILQTTFSNWLYRTKCFYFLKISQKFAPMGLMSKMQYLFQIMAWRRKGDKPLPESVMALLTDAYMCHPASMSLYYKSGLLVINDYRTERGCNLRSSKAHWYKINFMTHAGLL